MDNIDCSKTGRKRRPKHKQRQRRAYVHRCMLESACDQFVFIGCRDSPETTDGFIRLLIGSQTNHCYFRKSETDSQKNSRFYTISKLPAGSNYMYALSLLFYGLKWISIVFLRIKQARATWDGNRNLARPTDIRQLNFKI